MSVFQTQFLYILIPKTTYLFDFYFCFVLQIKKHPFSQVNWVSNTDHILVSIKQRDQIVQSFCTCSTAIFENYTRIISSNDTRTGFLDRH